MVKAAPIVIVSALWFVTATGAYAGPLDDNDVVRDARGQIIRSTAFGTCVRTNWEAGTDPCGEPEAEAAYERTVLSKDESTVYFEFDSASLTPAARQKLDRMATKLRQAPDVHRADIVGYADRIGSSNYNVALSRRRAATVKNYLAQRGYLNTQVVAVRGLGESRPTAQCEGITDRQRLIECLSPDRRVEAEIRYKETVQVPAQPTQSRRPQRSPRP